MTEATCMPSKRTSTAAHGQVWIQFVAMRWTETDADIPKFAQTASGGACSCEVLASCAQPAVQLTASREHLARLLYWCAAMQPPAICMLVSASTWDRRPQCRHCIPSREVSSGCVAYGVPSRGCPSTPLLFRCSARCMLAGHRARHLQGQHELERALNAREM